MSSAYKSAEIKTPKPMKMMARGSRVPMIALAAVGLGAGYYYWRKNHAEYPRTVRTTTTTLKDYRAGAPSSSSSLGSTGASAPSPGQGPAGSSSTATNNLDNPNASAASANRR